MSETDNQRYPEDSITHGVPLKLVFWDLFSSAQDPAHWSGIPFAIVHGLRHAGVEVATVGPTLPGLRRAISSLIWHFHNKITRKHYIPDRDAAVVRLFSWIDRHIHSNAFDGADAILTTSTTATAFLKTEKPIFIVHDMTWAQMLELYSYFHPSLQVPRILRNGYAMEAATFARPNVSLVLASAWAARRVLADSAIDPERVYVQPMGANFVHDPPRGETERAIDARGGAPYKVLFVGREFDRKGGQIAVDAVQNLRDRGIAAVLHVVGCRPTGLPAWVEVHGLLRKDDPAQARQLLELYASSHFFLLPTRAEAQGVVFNEAAAFGLPTVATDVGGVSTVVPPTGWGRLLPLEAPASAYAEALLPWIEQPTLYRKAAFEARDDYEARLSRRAYTTRLIEIIRGTAMPPPIEAGSRT